MIERPVYQEAITQYADRSAEEPRPCGCAGVVAWSLVRNEIDLLPWFLAHHRRLGVRHFIVLDDDSNDDTFDYLMAQDDCMVLDADVRYGELMDGVRGKERLRNEIARRFLLGRWAMQLDIDEYVVLPSGFSELSDFCRVLDDAQLNCCWANLIDLYPARFTDVLRPYAANEDPLSANCFDHGPYLALSSSADPPANSMPATLYGGVRERLFRQFGITGTSGSWAGNPVFAASPWVFKTPLVKWAPGRVLYNSHVSSERPGDRVLLALLHVKFAPGFLKRVERALAWGSYSNHSAEYRAYGFILERAKQQAQDFTFLHHRTRRYSSPRDLEQYGLLFADLPAARGVREDAGTAAISA